MKRTAALGRLIRTRGRGMRVALPPFMESAGTEADEHMVARLLGGEIEPMGDAFSWISAKPGKDREVTRSCWVSCIRVVHSGPYEVVVSDALAGPVPETSETGQPYRTRGTGTQPGTEL